MAKKTANEEKEIEVGAIVSRSEEFIEKNKKSIIAVIAGITEGVPPFGKKRLTEKASPKN